MANLWSDNIPYKKVKTNHGSAGIDGADFVEFEKHLNKLSRTVL